MDDPWDNDMGICSELYSMSFSDDTDKSVTLASKQ